MHAYLLLTEYNKYSYHMGQTSHGSCLHKTEER